MRSEMRKKVLYSGGKVVWAPATSEVSRRLLSQQLRQTQHNPQAGREELAPPKAQSWLAPRQVLLLPGGGPGR